MRVGAMLSQQPFRFVKAQAAGNDFVIFDNRDGRIRPDWRAFVRWVCDRHYGIGADGVILIENSSVADFRYVHLNSDGSPAGMCGNGSRCALRFVHEELGFAPLLRFEIGGRIYRGSVSGDEVTVEFPDRPHVEPPPAVQGSDWRPLASVFVGVPHLVLVVEDLDGMDVAAIGRELRHHPSFPEGSNVDFLSVLDRETLAVRTYERGVEAETLACGTGALASAAAAWKAGLVASVVRVRFRGGELRVDFSREVARLSGPAHLVFRGEFQLPRLPEGWDGSPR